MPHRSTNESPDSGARLLRHIAARLLGCAAWTVVALAAYGESVAAQTGAAYVGLGLIGSTLRLTDSLGIARVCVLQSVRGDELHVACRGGDTRAIDAHEIRRVDVRLHDDALEAHHVRTLKWVGIVSGAALGLLVAVPRVRAAERRNVILFPRARLLFDPLIGGIVGGISGDLVGHHLPAESWYPRYAAPDGTHAPR